MRLTIFKLLLLVLLFAFSCQQKQELAPISLDGLWMSDEYDFIYVNGDALYYYNYSCFGKSLFKNQGNGIYKTPYFPYVCTSDNGYFGEMTFQVKPIDAQSIFVINETDSCFFEEFHSDRELFKRFDPPLLAWDSLVMESYRYPEPEKIHYIATLRPDSLSRKVDPDTGRILSLEQEIWFISQDREFYYQYSYLYTSNADIKRYTLYFAGRKVMEQNVSRIPLLCYFKRIDQLAYGMKKKRDALTKTKTDRGFVDE